jgi:hypothetical protein
MIYQAIMNVPPKRYNELNINQRLIKILECQKLVKAQVKTANDHAFRPTAPNQPRNVKTPAHNRTHRTDPKRAILGPVKPPGSPGCPHCRGLPNEEQCIRRIKVDAQTNLDWLKNAVVTDAPEDDRMRPKVSFFYLYVGITETITR